MRLLTSTIVKKCNNGVHVANIAMINYTREYIYDNREELVNHKKQMIEKGFYSYAQDLYNIGTDDKLDLKWYGKYCKETCELLA